MVLITCARRWPVASSVVTTSYLASFIQLIYPHYLWIFNHAGCPPQVYQEMCGRFEVIYVAQDWLPMWTLWYHGLQGFKKKKILTKNDHSWCIIASKQYPPNIQLVVQYLVSGISKDIPAPDLVSTPCTAHSLHPVLCFYLPWKVLRKKHSKNV